MKKYPANFVGSLCEVLVSQVSYLVFNNPHFVSGSYHDESCLAYCFVRATVQSSKCSMLAWLENGLICSAITYILQVWNILYKDEIHYRVSHA